MSFLHRCVLHNSKIVTLNLFQGLHRKREDAETSSAWQFQAFFLCKNELSHTHLRWNDTEIKDLLKVQFRKENSIFEWLNNEKKDIYQR